MAEANLAEAALEGVFNQFMNLTTTPAVIYKLIQYSDKSAIALACTREHGKVKLFIPRAYSRKSGLLRFVPGTMNFNMKESSDLHRFSSFSHEPGYYHYTQNPDIIMRLHLGFDFFDSLFQPGQLCAAFWKLLHKYDDDNFREVSLYSIYRLLKEAGAAFTTACSGCGQATDRMYLHFGELFCENCAPKEGSGYELSSTELSLINIFQNSELFKAKRFSKDEEVTLIQLFSAYRSALTGSGDTLKSVGVFLSMI